MNEMAVYDGNTFSGVSALRIPMQTDSAAETDQLADQL
jgi:hypothetical protein